MERDLFDADRRDFRAVVGDFVAREVEPNLAAWEQAGVVDRSLYAKAGATESMKETIGGGRFGPRCEPCHISLI